MKKLFCLGVAAGLVWGLASFVKAPAPDVPAPLAPATRADIPQPVGTSSAQAKPLVAEKVSSPALTVYNQEIPYDPELLEVSSMREEEVEQEISRIDARLEKEKWSERANLGALSPAELLKLRGILRHRNQLFERKLDLAGL